MGFYSFVLRDPLKELMALWVNKVRPMALRDSVEHHDFVFINLNTLNAYTEQSFSRFMTAAFRDICSEEVNLQSVRRIMAEGFIFYKLLDHLFFHLILDRIPCKEQISNGMGVACNSYAYGCRFPEADIQSRWTSKASIRRGILSLQHLEAASHYPCRSVIGSKPRLE
jgi:hypothetical protein